MLEIYVHEYGDKTYDNRRRGSKGEVAAMDKASAR